MEKLTSSPRKRLFPAVKLKSSEKMGERLTIAPLDLAAIAKEVAADFEEPVDRRNKMRKINNNSGGRKIFFRTSAESQIFRPSTGRVLPKRSVNSQKEHDRPVEYPLFKTDPETGKVIPLPQRWMCPILKSSEKKVKKTLPVTPLDMAAIAKERAADLEEPVDRKNKVQKVNNNSVRRKMFNLPSAGSQISQFSISSRRTLSRRSITSQKEQQNKFKPGELSPLLDMEEVEEELIKKKGFLQGYPFKTPVKPVIKFNENVKSFPFIEQSVLNKQNIPRIVVTTDSLSPNESEFLQLEKVYRADDSGKVNECDKSPISSVCNLLEETIINSSRKEKNNKLNTRQNIINDLENMLTEYRTTFDEYKTTHDANISKIAEILETDRTQYATIVALQEKNQNAITRILDGLKSDSSDTNKENTPVHNRRSMRLFNKSPRQTQSAKFVVSPAVLSKDLRKSTLTKNLVTKTQQYNIESPRIKKALDMYNSIRCEISVLATPKFERNDLNESPRSTNLTRNLSRRIQSQCLLLQDTPIHK
ncbi:uncharacterized protein LOC108907908 isoform X2 [Anoplophora glabripennis]|uniref:uncharacterized protein LOC108907908 isoform X2 n=1 Tax=Anoplophora glabripennis TaxID=217634 RepID=UPI000874AAA4|nr:uncharacterized protein LOC108907908 isoform X2 [Anoplophora glabripennis]